MKSYILTEGLHFSDKGLIEHKFEEVPAFDKNTSKAQALDALYGALEVGDVSIVKLASDFLWNKNPCSPGTADKVSARMAEIQNIPSQALDILDEYGVINRAVLIGGGQKQQNKSILGWLLKDPESILLAETNGNETRMTSNGGQRQSCLMLLTQLVRCGGAAEAADLELDFIFRDLDMQPETVAEMLYLGATFTDNNSNSGIAALTEVIWSPETYHLMRPGMNDTQIDMSLTKGCKGVIRQVLNDDDPSLSTALRVETIAELSPRLAQAMQKYWKLPVEFLTKEHAGKWSYEDHSKLQKSLPGIAPPEHNDLLDCAIRVGAPWVEDALMAEGLLHNEVIRRLKNDNGPLMAGLILGFRPPEVHLYTSRLIKKVGEDWKDSKGRGLGHYIIRACNYPTENLLRALLRTKSGVKLLSEMDDGQTALSFLEAHEEWKSGTKSKTDLIQRAKRKVLEHISLNTQTHRKKTNNIKF